MRILSVINFLLKNKNSLSLQPLYKGINKPHIALFVPSLNGGGAEKVMVALANAFVERGCAVDLLLAKAHGPYLEKVSPKVRVFNLKAERVVKALLPLTLYLIRENPTAMLSAMTHANVIAILARLISFVSTRLVVSEHSTISVEMSQSQGLTARMICAMVPKLYKRVDGIVAVSKGSAADLVRFANLPAYSVDVIYNPFGYENIQSLATEKIDHPWFTADQPPVVLAIGRLCKEKDFCTLIYAFARLRAEGRPLRLLILGEGELRSSLERLISECGLSADEVHLAGFVSNPYAYMARCAVFVLSSRWEGLSMVLIEAMACGVPVISTDCPSGPREILEDGRWGILVPVGDKDAIANAIKKVLSTSPSKLPDVRLRVADFDERKIVDAYLNVLTLPVQIKS
jgi:glycosyltransferase involved in cell wall biosynthesis